MKNIIKTISLIALLTIQGVSFANITREEEMTTLKQELVTLKDNVKKYSQAKYEEYTTQTKKILSKQKKLIGDLKDEQKAKLQKQWEKLEKEMKDLGDAAQDKKEALYQKMASNLENLNDKIDKASNK